MQRKQQAASRQDGESGSIFASRARPIYFNALARKRYCGLTSSLTVASFLAMAGSGALADDATALGKPVAQPTNEQLIEKLERMEARIRVLETELHRKGETAESKKPKVRTTASRGNPAKALAGAKDTAPGSPAYNETAALEPPPPNKDLFGLAPSPLPGLKIGAYGELRFGAQQNPAANGQWQTGFDAARVVLLPTYQFNDNIVFNSEIEFEHAGAGFDADDKLHGTAEIEQAYVDFRISPYFNIRAPGIDLVPIDWLNLHHEPTLFYSVRRPELDNGLIPTTWKAPATSIYGQIIEGLNYQFQISQALEDFGGDFSLRTDANGVSLFPIPYAPGIDGVTALGFSKAPLGDFRQLSNYLGYTFRLSYAPSFLPGFDGGSSVYFTPSTTPRGAHADTGALLGRSSLAIFETDFRYHVPDTGLEFRGEFADVIVGNPANLRANNDGDPTNNAGKTLFGASGEVAYHIPFGPVLGSNWEAVPFYRYTYQNFQTGGFAGTDLNFPAGSGRMQFHDVGVALYPTPELVLKLNYTKALNVAPGGARSDSVLGGVGFFF
ncbi:MAG: hypothetical protein M3178_18920 [Pseudomonadota bacterium]|nr:hypothetical protein [Pseudomonadota bacterium]